VHSNIASKLEKYTIKKPKEKKLKKLLPLFNLAQAIQTSP
jgi:hypothetical protein